MYVLCSLYRVATHGRLQNATKSSKMVPREKKENEGEDTMKKRLFVVLTLLLAVNMVACGSSNTADVDNSNISIEELQERIEELEEENAELKDALGKIEEVNTSEPETWADDYVIAFCDSRFTENVQKITGKSSDITYGDVKGIRDIGFAVSVSVQKIVVVAGSRI